MIEKGVFQIYRITLGLLKEYVIHLLAWSSSADVQLSFETETDQNTQIRMNLPLRFTLQISQLLLNSAH